MLKTFDVLSRSSTRRVNNQVRTKFWSAWDSRLQDNLNGHTCGCRENRGSRYARESIFYEAYVGTALSREYATDGALRSQLRVNDERCIYNQTNSIMGSKVKVIASSYFTTVTADSLSAFYGKVKEAEKKSRQKAQLISGIVQFVKYEYIDIPDDADDQEGLASKPSEE